MCENESNGEPVFLYYENGPGRAFNVVFKREVSKEHNLSFLVKRTVTRTLVVLIPNTSILCPFNDFLRFEIIKWAKDRGLQNFVLGGGYSADDGIFQYKMNLAPYGIKDFYIGRKLFDEETYQELLYSKKQRK